jgi:hypothetical protein
VISGACGDKTEQFSSAEWPAASAPTSDVSAVRVRCVSARSSACPPVHRGQPARKRWPSPSVLAASSGSSRNPPDARGAGMHTRSKTLSCRGCSPELDPLIRLGRYRQHERRLARQSTARGELERELEQRRALEQLRHRHQLRRFQQRLWRWRQLRQLVARTRWCSSREGLARAMDLRGGGSLHV